MIKKILLLTLILCVAAFAWGCGDKDGAAGSGSDDAKDNELSQTDVYAIYDTLDLNDYITLGQYRGVEISKTVPEEVTEEEIQAEVDSFLSGNKYLQEVVGRTIVETGDTVNIDYVGVHDGEAFQGGTDTGANLTIGTGQFIPGFEDSLIGKSKGETVDLNLTFPDPYQNNPDLAGEDVVFTVTINSIQEYITPELTDELVSEKTAYQTVAAYRESIRTAKEDEAVFMAEEGKISTAWEAAMANVTFKSLPQEALDAYKANLDSTYEYYASMSGMTFEEVLTNTMGFTLEEYETEAMSYAENMVKYDLVFLAIVEKEQLTVTDEEFEAGKAEYLASYGYESEEKFEEASGESFEDYVGRDAIEKNVLWQKTLQLVADAAIEI